MSTRPHLSISPEVATALADSAPIVALESTIVSHGMPYPQNVETALRCQEIAREEGAVPATCAVVGGALCAGLADEQLEALGRKGRSVAKASRRDLPLLVARRADGATTVAGTMIIAAMAGIRVLATGGIGGVHRGAETTMDVSADLEELARTPVAVVCAGAKAILDLALTMEVLETRGVPVVGFGTDELPAFYTRTSGIALTYRLDTPEEAAAAITAQRALGFPGGMVVANPIPEEHAMDPAAIDSAIERALARSGELGLRGKDVTPYLLAEIERLTGGDSLASNVELVFDNVRLAARIARALCTE